MVNVLHAMVVDSIYDEDKRKKIAIALEWADIAAEQADIDQDEQTRSAMAAVGLSGARVEEMMYSQIRARTEEAARRSQAMAKDAAVEIDAADMMGAP